MWNIIWLFIFVNSALFCMQPLANRIWKSLSLVMMKMTTLSPVKRLVKTIFMYFYDWSPGTFCIQCICVEHVYRVSVCTPSEMFRTSCSSFVRRDRGGSRRRQWPCRLKENNWRGFTELRYYSSHSDSLIFHQILSKILGALLSSTSPKIGNPR